MSLMPELPEVETIRVGLQRLMVGKVVRDTHNYNSEKSFPNAPADVARFVLGATVTEVKRRAKMLLIELSSEYTLTVHLKMTGQLVFIGPCVTKSDGSASASDSLGANGQSVLPRFAGKAKSLADANPSDFVQPLSLTSNIQHLQSSRWGGGHPNDSLIGVLPDNTTREHIDFTDGSRLYFNDLRKFGYMKLVPTSLVSELPFMQKVGPEPLEDDFTGDVLFERLQRRKNTSIKAAILDQSVLAGVGNIYADESLWMAKIHPKTLVKNLPKSKIQNLSSAIKSVMNLSLEHGGSTDKNYVDAEGKKGSYLKFANVFRLEGQPCPRCGTTIEKIRVAGRGTHVCPVCQKIDKKLTKYYNIYYC